MGYITDFQGEITITPPIPWGQIKDSPWIPKAAKDRDEDVMFQLVDTVTETTTGQSVTRTAVAVVSTWDEEARGYDIVEHLQRVVDAYPDHEFGGHIDAEGEECADLWRLAVVDRKAVKIKPVITWPGEADPRITRALMDAAQAQGALRAAKDALAVQALHALRCIPDGLIQHGCAQLDDAKVREDLRAAYRILLDAVCNIPTTEEI
jgi:hypothetical protein